MNDDNQINPIIPEKKSKGFFRELLEIIAIVVFILLPIRFYIAQPFVVVGSSLSPTFTGGDYLIVDEISYRFNEPKRGDVIVFVPPLAIKDHYIKRIIGLPGDTVSVVGNVVKIINKENPNGFTLEEPYVHSERSANKEVTLSTDQYFVMGDNRAVSSDSRVFGPITRDEISGRVFVRLYPVTAIDYLPGSVVRED